MSIALLTHPLHPSLIQCLSVFAYCFHTNSQGLVIHTLSTLKRKKRPRCEFLLTTRRQIRWDMRDFFVRVAFIIWYVISYGKVLHMKAILISIFKRKRDRWADEGGESVSQIVSSCGNISRNSSKPFEFPLRSSPEPPHHWRAHLKPTDTLLSSSRSLSLFAGFLSSLLFFCQQTIANMEKSIKCSYLIYVSAYMHSCTHIKYHKKKQQHRW